MADSLHIENQTSVDRNEVTPPFAVLGNNSIKAGKPEEVEPYQYISFEAYMKFLEISRQALTEYEEALLTMENPTHNSEEIRNAKERLENEGLKHFHLEEIRNRPLHEKLIVTINEIFGKRDPLKQGTNGFSKLSLAIENDEMPTRHRAYFLTLGQFAKLKRELLPILYMYDETLVDAILYKFKIYDDYDKE